MKRRNIAVIAVVAIVLIVVGVLVVSSHQKAHRSATKNPPGSTGSPGSPGQNKPPSGTKTIIRGLIDRQGEPRRSMLPYVHAYVVKVNWADLQPTPDGPITANNAIDQAIARVRQPDYKRLGMKLKLRVFTGVGSPNWAKELGGPPIPYKNNQAGSALSGGTLPRFWSKPLVTAYAQLQQKLAAKYDDVPEIREVTVSGCSTLYDEPFVRQVGSAGNVKGIETAGYTVAADKACISAAIRAHEVWKHTTSDLDFSPYPDITKPSGDRDLNFTLGMMKVCRTDLGFRCGLQNNALSTDKIANSVFQKLYKQMQALGTPLIFQTAAKSRLGNPQQVLDAATGMGANSVELPQGYPKWPKAILQAAAAKLLANPAR